MMNVSTLHRLRRVVGLMKANAERATRGRWWVSHSHVLAFGKNKQPFDVACEPWLKSQTVYSVNEDPDGPFKNMRHIATCYPDAIIQLAADIQTLLEERNEIVERCAEIAEKFPKLIPTGEKHVRQVSGADIAKAIRALIPGEHNEPPPDEALPEVQYPSK